MDYAKVSEYENVSVEFHDSDVASVELRDSDLIITLSPAVVHRSPGIPGVDPGTCWSQDAVLLLPGGLIQGARPWLPSTLSEGTITAGDQSYENVIPVCSDLVGRVNLRLTFVNGDQLGVDAQGLKVVLMGSARFIGTFD